MMYTFIDKKWHLHPVSVGWFIGRSTTRLILTATYRLELSAFIKFDEGTKINFGPSSKAQHKLIQILSKFDFFYHSSLFYHMKILKY